MQTKARYLSNESHVGGSTQAPYFQRLRWSRLRKGGSFAWSALLAISLGLPLAAPAAQSQNPGAQEPGAPTAEIAPVQQTEKQRLAETKVQLQQKQLAEDTAKLFELANELKADMDKSTKDTLSLTVVKKAEQVEKLAHKVREEMKASLGN